jgi:hypothetical protein
VDVHVIRQWKRRKAAPGTKPTESEKHTWKAKLRGYFSKTKSAADKKKAKALAKQGVPLLPNFLVARGFGNAILLGLNNPVSHYQSTIRVQGLPRGFRRYYVAAEDLPPQQCANGELQRSCIENVATKERRLELTRTARPKIHGIADCGAVGFRKWLWACTGGGIRGSFASDVVAHDCHNSVKNAIYKMQTCGW